MSNYPAKLFPFYLIVALFSFATPVFCQDDQPATLQTEAKIYRDQGLQLQQEGNIEEALSYYQKALIIDPNYAAVYNDIGILLEARDRPEQARYMYLKAIEVAPDYPNSYSNLALLYEDEKDYTNAILNWIKRASMGGPQDPWAEAARKRLEDIAHAYPEAYSKIGQQQLQYTEQESKHEEEFRPKQEELAKKKEDKERQLEEDNAKREEEFQAKQEELAKKKEDKERQLEEDKAKREEEFQAKQEELARLKEEKQRQLEEAKAKREEERQAKQEEIAKKKEGKARQTEFLEPQEAPQASEDTALDNKTRALNYLARAKKSFSKGEYVAALKDATIAGYLDSSNTEISAFVDKIRKAILR